MRIRDVVRQRRRALRRNLIVQTRVACRRQSASAVSPGDGDTAVPPPPRSTASHSLPYSARASGLARLPSRIRSAAASRSSGPAHMPTSASRISAGGASAARGDRAAAAACRRALGDQDERRARQTAPRLRAATRRAQSPRARGRAVVWRPARPDSAELRRQRPHVAAAAQCASAKRGGVIGAGAPGPVGSAMRAIAWRARAQPSPDQHDRDGGQKRGRSGAAHPW